MLKVKRRLSRPLFVIALGLCLFLSTAGLWVGMDEAGSVRADEADVSLEVIAERGYPYYNDPPADDGYAVIGVLKNTGTTNVCDIYVNLKIYWSSGVKKGEGTRKAYVPILAPGETSSFSVWASYVAPELIDYYRLEVKGFETNEEPYHALKVVNDHVIREGDFYRLWGELENISGGYLQEYGYGSVHLMWFDEAGEPLDNEFPSVASDSRYLAPGDTAVFYENISIFDDYDSYEIWTVSEALEPGLRPVPISMTVNGWHINEDDEFVLAATLCNEGQVTAEDIDTTVIYRDSEGYAIGWWGPYTGYPGIYTLEPGECGSFSDDDYDPPEGFATFDAYAWSETLYSPPTYALSVSKQGHGLVTSTPGSIDCGSVCADTFYAGTDVTLNATADPHWTFVDWSGDLNSTDNPLQATIEDDTDVTATFEEEEYTLDVSTVGHGAVAKEPEQDVYRYGDEVTLTATAEPGWTFLGLSGDINTTENPVNVVVQDDTSITATFAEEYTLDVTIVGEGNVDSEPEQATYVHGDVVTLTATADAGWSFHDWSGDVESTDNPLELMVEGNTVLTATFTQDDYALDVSVVGQGTVTKEPDQDAYRYGDVVTLTAIADPNWTFVGWSGDVDSTDNPLELVVEDDTVIVAAFNKIVYLPLVLKKQ